MTIQNNHAHAYTLYTPISPKLFVYLLWSIIECRLKNCISLTAHIPLEIMHPNTYPDKATANRLIRFGTFVSSILGIQLYWENAPLLRYGTWDLLYGQLNWNLIPTKVDLCLDTGHLILGSLSKEEARNRINGFLDRFGKQIKHVHLHENDLKTDKHWVPFTSQAKLNIITPALFKRITKDRTYIFELSN